MMSQQYNPTTSKRQRQARAQRNRPVLVTGSELEQPGEPVRTTETLVTETTPLAETAAAVGQEKTRRPSRLPGFFSKVEKNTQEEAKPEVDVVQARLARATRGKVSTSGIGTTPAPKENVQKETKARSAATPAKKVSAAPQSSTKLFQSRHFVGMALYLLAAEFLLPVETRVALLMGIEHPLAQFPLFGSKVTITPSFFVNIGTLILLLYILLKVNLLPNTSQAARAARARSLEAERKNSQAATPVVKQAPPAIRPGVKGEDDELYQAYRIKQRREKKR